MANPRYEVTFQDKKLRQFLNHILARSKDIDNKADNYIRGILSANIIQDVSEHFDEQDGGPRIGPWPEWSDMYLERMRKRGKAANNILVDTARLKNNFRVNSYRKNPTSVTFFNNAKTKGGFPYAAAHNEGGPKLPRRRFMWLSLDARKRIAEQSLKFLTGAMK